MRLSTLASRIVRRRRAGLTLMELVVVMVILVALAGVLLPMFPSMLTRAHTSTTATNATEASKAVQLYYNMYSGYPNNLDNLVSGGSASSVASYVAAATTPYTGTPGAGGDLGVLAFTGTTDLNLVALQNAGIMTVLNVTAAPTATGTSFNPTFNPYGTTAITGVPSTLTTLSSSVSVVQVNPSAVARELGILPIVTTTTTGGTATTTTNWGTYVMFGLGDYSSMAGKTMEEAPVHFDDAAGGSPDVIYGRFGLVFQTQDGSGTALPAAKFVGTVDLADTGGITTASDHIQTYFNLK